MVGGCEMREVRGERWEEGGGRSMKRRRDRNEKRERREEGMRSRRNCRMQDYEPKQRLWLRKH